MDSKKYLKSYGWREGEALKDGGLRKPILVKHKRDKKGLGGAAGHDDGEAWWERLFDGHLKSLDVNANSDGSGITFKQKEAVASGVSRAESPLYKWFIKGEGLSGTISKPDDQNIQATIIAVKRKRDDMGEKCRRKVKKIKSQQEYTKKGKKKEKKHKDDKDDKDKIGKKEKKEKKKHKDDKDDKDKIGKKKEKKNKDDKDDKDKIGKKEKKEKKKEKNEKRKERKLKNLKNSKYLKVMKKKNKREEVHLNSINCQCKRAKL